MIGFDGLGFGILFLVSDIVYKCIVVGGHFGCSDLMVRGLGILFLASDIVYKCIVVGGRFG